MWLLVLAFGGGCTFISIGQHDVRMKVLSARSGYSDTGSLPDDTAADDSGDADPPIPSCETTPTEGWSTWPIDPHSDTLVLEYSARVGSAGVDCIVALSEGQGNDVYDYSVLVRFSDDDEIDMRDGEAYSAAAPISYAPDTLYVFRVIADIAEGTARATVMGADDQVSVIHDGASFRDTAQQPEAIDHIGIVCFDGTMDWCDPVVSP